MAEGTKESQSSSSNDGNEGVSGEGVRGVTRFESRIEELSDFLGALDTYSPTVPLEAVEYYLNKAGVDASVDARVVKMVALASDRFLGKIVEEAKQAAKLRSGRVARNSRKRRSDTSYLLETSDLGHSLASHRINVRRRMVMDEKE